VKAGAPKFSKTDKRLLGKWKSDKRKTFADWNWKPNTPPLKKRKLKSFFGNLILTFTRTRIVYDLPHRKWQRSWRYAVLGVDETSAAIIVLGKPEIKNRGKYSRASLQIVEDFWSKPEIQHIHFEKKWFWASIGIGRNREFFRKLGKSA
jgi:hypothetical protein